MGPKFRLVKVPCPVCELHTFATVAVVERAATIVCAHCGHVIRLDAGLRRSVLDDASIPREADRESS